MLWAPAPPCSAPWGAKPARRQTNGPGRNGISTAKPKRGGSVTFGIDTEESGFDPTTARWDEGGFLYGRTVFDPLAIVNAAGQVEPYLAQSITSNADFTAFTITLRPGIVFHDGTPLDANGAPPQPREAATLHPDRARLRRPTSPAPRSPGRCRSPSP